MIQLLFREIKAGSDYKNPIEAIEGISKYIDKYNSRRPHTCLEDKTLNEGYGIAT